MPLSTPKFKNPFQPTPALLRNFFNILLYLTGLWVFIAPILHIPAHTMNTINDLAIKILPITRFTISFLHLDYVIPDTTISTDPNVTTPTT